MHGWRTGLFPRLFAAFLLVIGVTGVTLLAAALSLGPVLLERHLESMNLALTGTSPGAALMLSDLRASYRAALSGSLLWAVVVAVLVAGVLALFVTSQVVAPLRRLQNASDRIARGHYDERLDPVGPGEVSSLARSFNDMVGTLQAGEAQRVELVRNLAHEVRTPLGNLRGYLEGLEDGLFAPSEETFTASKRQVTRLERLLDDLSLLSRVEAKQEPVQPVAASLEEICSRTLGAVRPQFVQKGVTLRCKTIPPDLTVWADPLRTEQVLTNLLTNALRHTPAGGEVVLWHSLEGDEGAAMHVRDSGEGIPPDALPHVFERFYRADTSRQTSRQGDGGSGIGLTIAKYFVEAQGGRIFAQSRPGEGSHFWFTMRRASEGPGLYPG